MGVKILSLYDGMACGMIAMQLTNNRSCLLRADEIKADKDIT